MTKGSKFSALEAERIAARWSTFKVPEEFAAAAAYSRVYQRSLDYHVKRIAVLGVEGERALDVGCGCGQWSFALASKFDRVTGMDLTTARIDLCSYLRDQFEIDRVTFRESGAVPLDEPGESCDFIFCYSVLLSVLSLPACLNEFYRVLKPGSQFYISLNGPGWAKYLRDERGADNPRDRANGIETYYNSICQYRLGRSESSFRNLRVLMASIPQKIDAYCNKKGGDSQKARDVLTQLRASQRVETQALTEASMNYAAAIGKSVNSEYEAIDHVEQLLATLSAPTKLTAVAQEIEKECGKEHVQTFLNDLILILAGRPYTFSYARSGRIYFVDEVRDAVTAAGFESFVYADEGCLQMDPAAEMVAPIYPKVSEEFKVWDFMARKPAA